jgi:enamine deaminase RidA (YjgF/YER057c/UK114 family)
MQQVQFINPPELPAYGYTNTVVVQGPVKTIYVGGQDAVNAKGEIVGVGDLAIQTRQVLHNLEIALAAGGATLKDVVKLNIFVVQGQNLIEGFRVSQEKWGESSNPPSITVAIVSQLARPEYLVEMDAIAVVPLG